MLINVATDVAEGFKHNANWSSHDNYLDKLMLKEKAFIKTVFFIRHLQHEHISKK